MALCCGGERLLLTLPRHRIYDQGSKKGPSRKPDEVPAWHEPLIWRTRWRIRSITKELEISRETIILYRSRALRVSHDRFIQHSHHPIVERRFVLEQQA